jgi:hypothetical protein
MDASVAALVGAALGSLTTLAATLITGVLQRQRDAAQSVREWRQEIRRRTAHVNDDAVLAEYTRDVRVHQADLLAAVCLLRGYYQYNWNAFRELVEQVRQFDVRIATGLAITDDAAWDAHFGPLHEEVDDFYDLWIGVLQQALLQVDGAPAGATAVAAAPQAANPP